MKAKLLKSAKQKHARSRIPPTKHPQNELNDLTGNKWMFLTQSVTKTNFPKSYAFELRRKHGANKPPELMKDLISFFTRKGASVLDPFAGVGGTLMGAALCSSKGLGIEINTTWVSLYKQACRAAQVKQQEVLCGDCLSVMDNLIAKRRKFSLILTDPPYNIRFDRTMCHGKYANRNRITEYGKFSNLADDFSNSENYEGYLAKMALFIEKGYRLLRKNRYLILITKNAYQNGRYQLVSKDLADIGEKYGFTLKGEIIWYQNGVRLRPYGYPFTYVPNIIHHNILILRKEMK
jgi:DNA modification methylase